jgi:predicted transcriptional regulator
MSEYYYLYLTDEEEATHIGVTVQTIKKYHKSLIKKGYLEIVEIDGQKVKRFKFPKE